MWALGRKLAKLVLGAAVLAATALGAAGHGFMTEPAARNAIHNSNSCPHCLPAGGPGLTYANGRKWTAAGSKMWDPKVNAAHGVCGDPHTGPLHHEAGGKYATKMITGVYRQGQVITIRIKITAPHGGRFIFGICPVPDGASDSKERSVVTQQCFDRNRLKNAQDGSDYWWFGKRGNGEYSMQFRLPPNIVCKRCVLQWHWESGNSCNLPGTPEGMEMSASMGSCEGSSSLEEFWNCADVTVLPKGAPMPPTPKPFKVSSSLGQDAAASSSLRAARLQQAQELQRMADSLPKGPIRDAVLGQVKTLKDIAAGKAGEGFADYSTAFGAVPVVPQPDSGYMVAIVAVASVALIALPLTLSITVGVSVLVYILAQRAMALGWPWGGGGGGRQGGYSPLLLLQGSLASRLPQVLKRRSHVASHVASRKAS